MPRNVYEMTMKGSGITVRIRKVSPLLVMELRKVYPPPEPPMNKVILDGKEKYEPNPADPSYAKALKEHESMLEVKMRLLMFTRGVEVEVNKQEVDELRAFWKETYNKELEGTDKEIYVSYVVIGSDEDLEDLIKAILQRSQPTAEDVNAAMQSFPSQV